MTIRPRNGFRGWVVVSPQLDRSYIMDFNRKVYSNISMYGIYRPPPPRPKMYTNLNDLNHFKLEKTKTHTQKNRKKEYAAYCQRFIARWHTPAMSIRIVFRFQVSRFSSPKQYGPMCRPFSLSCYDIDGHVFVTNTKQYNVWIIFRLIDGGTDQQCVLLTPMIIVVNTYLHLSLTWYIVSGIV